MQTLKNLWAAFFTDAHAVALKNADKNGDGKVDLKDVQAEYEKAKAALKAKQASYWNSAGVVIATFAAGCYVGAHWLAK